MLLKSFFGLLSLTAGSVILGFACLMIAFITLVSNLYFLVHFEIGVIFILVFVMFQSVSGAMMIAAPYKESRKVSLIAFALIILTLLIFVIGSTISLANQTSLLKYVCVHNGKRCPETTWGASLHFRAGTTFDHKNVDVKGRVDSKNTPITRNVRRRQLDIVSERPDGTTPRDSTAGPAPAAGGADVTPSTTTENEYDYEETSTEGRDTIAEWEKGYKFGLHLIASVILFGINILFLLFCSLIELSYYQELEYFAKLHAN